MSPKFFVLQNGALLFETVLATVTLFCETVLGTVVCLRGKSATAVPEVRKFLELSLLT